MKESLTVKIVYFLINPLLALFSAFRDMKPKSSLIIVGIFYLWFGMSFEPRNESADSYRYNLEFQRFSDNPDQQMKGVWNAYTNDQTFYNHYMVKDLYVYVMYYITAKIAPHNHHVLFFLFACVFTFFNLVCLRYITREKQFNNSWPIIILLLLFLYSNAIFNINGVRFWTASWIAVTIMYRVLIDKHTASMLWLVVLPFIHGSYILFIAFFIISWIAKSKLNVLAKIYVISFFFGQIGMMVMDSIRAYMPAWLDLMVYNYTESDWGKNRMAGGDTNYMSFYAQILYSLPRWYMLGLLFLASLRRQRIHTKLFLGFTLAYFSCVNFSTVIPSVARYFVVGYPLIIYIWVANFNALKRYKQYVMAAPICFAYVVFQLIRNMLSVSDWYSYVSIFSLFI